MSKIIKPFKVAVSQEGLYDLQARLARTRYTDEIPGSEGAYGVPVERVKQLADRWLNSFDWREFEARINAHPQFTTQIDGANVHFLHIKSAKPDALALVLTHGWPGSIAKYLNVIGELSAEFHLVIPSVPGFGFSGPTTSPGWGTARTAAAWVELMHRLGYKRYGAVGNDGGQGVTVCFEGVPPLRAAALSQRNASGDA